MNNHPNNAPVSGACFLVSPLKGEETWKQRGDLDETSMKQQETNQRNLLAINILRMKQAGNNMKQNCFIPPQNFKREMKQEIAPILEHKNSVPNMAANPANRNHVGGVIANANPANQNSSNGVTTKNPVGDLAGAANDQEENSSSGVIPEFPDTLTRVCESGGNAPLEWFVGYAALRAMPTPAGFAREEWSQLKNDVGLFLEHWGAKAAALGWTTLELFGIHPIARMNRVDCLGFLFLVHGRTVTDITSTTATFITSRGKTQTYRRGAIAECQIEAWELRHCIPEHGEPVRRSHKL